LPAAAYFQITPADSSEDAGAMPPEAARAGQSTHFWFSLLHDSRHTPFIAIAAIFDYE